MGDLPLEGRSSGDMFDRTFNPALRLFHCEYDLLFVAKTGLLVTYWGPLFALIAGPPATQAHGHLLGLL